MSLSSLSFFVIALTSFVTLLFGQKSNPAEWEFVKERKNVKVYCKEVGDQSAFRGKGIIEGTPEKLIGVIHNPKRWKFWIDNLEFFYKKCI